MSEPIGADHLGAHGDDVYAMLIEAHAGLDEAESRRLDACLVLLLANAVGDVGRIREAMAAARRTIRPDEAPSPR